MSNQIITPVTIQKLIERLRQERETFDLRKLHAIRWNNLRLTMGYSSIVLMFLIIVICSFIIFKNDKFPAPVVIGASSALFADVLGLIICVWKIVLNPSFQTPLEPVTAITNDSNIEQ